MKAHLIIFVTTGLLNLPDESNFCFDSIAILFSSSFE